MRNAVACGMPKRYSYKAFLLLKGSVSWTFFKKDLFLHFLFFCFFVSCKKQKTKKNFSHIFSSVKKKKNMRETKFFFVVVAAEKIKKTKKRYFFFLLCVETIEKAGASSYHATMVLLQESASQTKLSLFFIIKFLGGKNL